MGSLGDDRAETTVDTDVRRSLYALRTSANLFEIANDELLLVSELMVPGSAVREAASDDLDLLALRYDLPWTGPWLVGTSTWPRSSRHFPQSPPSTTTPRGPESRPR